MSDDGHRLGSRATEIVQAARKPAPTVTKRVAPRSLSVTVASKTDNKPPFRYITTGTLKLPTP
jgi:hypothetical protein